LEWKNSSKENQMINTTKRNIAQIFGTLSLVLLLGACTSPRTLDSSSGLKIAEAVQANDLPALKELLANVPSDISKRNEADQKVVNSALQMTIGKGENCNLEMANYLYGLGGLADYLHMGHEEFSGFRADYQKWKAPLCGDFVIDSQRKYLSRKVNPLLTSEVYERQQNESKEAFVKYSYNNVIAFLNNVNYKVPTEVSYGITKFSAIIAQAIDYGKEGCRKDPNGEICRAYGNYRQLPQEILAKKEFSKKSDAYKQLKAFSDSLAITMK
jgi:hypothetical protein